MYDASNPALESIVRIKDAAVEVTNVHAAAKAAAARTQLIMVALSPCSASRSASDRSGS